MSIEMDVVLAIVPVLAIVTVLATLAILTILAILGILIILTILAILTILTFLSERESRESILHCFTDTESIESEMTSFTSQT